MDFKQKLLFKTLEQNIQKKDLQKAETSSSLLYIDKSLSKNARKRLKKSFSELASLFLGQKDYVNSIKNLELARSITPQDSKLVNREFKIFSDIFTLSKDSFTEEDLLVFSAIISLLIEPYKEEKVNFFSPSIKIEIDLSKKIKELLTKAPKEAESKFSFSLEQILNSLDPGLSEDERIKKAAEILTPAIIEHIKKKMKKAADSDKKK